MIALCVECVDTFEGVEALSREWSELESATPEATGFQSFAWCRTWLQLAGDRVSPRILCLREGGRLVLIAPFQIERRLGVSIACWVGEPLTQYGDALARPGAERAGWRDLALAEIARWRDVDLVALTRLRADGVFCAGDSAGEPLAAPFADLRSRTPRRQKSVERRARWLETKGTVALVEARTSEQRESLARHALALKRAWLRRRGAYSIGLSHPVSEDFLATLAREGFVRVNALMVGDDVAALDVGFFGQGAYRSMLGCFDERFADGAPGHALTGRLIARLAGEGLAAYDMLPPADAYKRAWASGETRIEARFIATSLKGRLAAFALARLRPLAKRLVHALGRFEAAHSLSNAFALGFPRLQKRNAHCDGANCEDCGRRGDGARDARRRSGQCARLRHEFRRGAAHSLDG
jgi:CelD/BcsL family acetyltransferase involved in cellulose biosynthesis